MFSIWTKHLKDPEEKKRFESSLRNSQWILERQSGILNEMEDSVNSLELDAKIYDIPNWDYRQADLNGYRRCLRQIKKLNNLDNKESISGQSN